MTDVAIEQLKKAVELQHTCTAVFAQSVPVLERRGDTTVWQGTVHVFDINGHPKATRAYAWSSPIEGSDKRQFFVVLHQGPVTSPLEAVRAAIVAEHRTSEGEMSEIKERFNPEPWLRSVLWLALAVALFVAIFHGNPLKISGGRGRH